MSKWVSGIALIVIGAIAIGFSIYIKNEVAEGKIKVHRAEKGVSEGKKLFGFSDATKPIGDVVASPFEKKISEGKSDIAKYEKISNWLVAAGIILIIIGILLIIFGLKKKKE